MLTLLVVLSFPLILGVGYTLLFVLSGRDLSVVTGPAGFLLYALLLTIPAGTVLVTSADRILEALACSSATAVWLPAGLVAGIGLWGVQQWGLPGQTPDASARVWIGPRGWIGFAVLLVPVAYGVLAEEVIWRVWLVPEVGLPLSSAAFALHHYHFGPRHVVFAFVAGLVWGGLFVVAQSLWPSAASHLIYNALAWRHMRRSASAAACAGCIGEAGAG